MAIGLLERPIGSVPEEQIGTYLVAGREGTIGAAFAVGSSYRPEDHYLHETAAASIGHLVTRQVWALPAEQDAMLLFARRTRVPASFEGGEVLAVSGLVVGVTELDCDRIHVLAGDRLMLPAGYLGENVRPEWGVPPMVEATRGNHLGAFLRMPLWGFGVDQIGIPSDMRLDINDKVERYQELGDLSVLSDAERAEIDALSDELRFHGLAGSHLKDDKYQRARVILRERHPELIGRLGWSAPRTSRDFAELDAAMAEAVRVILDEEDMEPTGPAR